MARNFELLKNSTALVIVDMQNDFVRKGAPMNVPDALGTVDAIKKLVGFARKKEMPVIWARFVTGTTPMHLWNWSPEIESYNLCKRHHSRYYSDIDKTQECAEIIEELLELKESKDYVVDKYNYSAFRNTNLIDILKSEGRDTLIVAGTVTQICVEDTINDAFAMDIKAIGVSDGTSSFDENQHQTSLDNIAMKYGMVMTTDEIIAAYENE